jgi:hypothetical protein
MLRTHILIHGVLRYGKKNGQNWVGSERKREQETKGVSSARGKHEQCDTTCTAHPRKLKCDRWHGKCRSHGLEAGHMDVKENAKKEGANMYTYHHHICLRYE